MLLLDEPHRNHLVASIQGRGQVLITATDLQPFPPDFLEKASRFRVAAGRVQRYPD